MKEVTVAIDIGGIDSEIGLVSEDGKCLEKETVTTNNFADATDFIDAGVETINRLVHRGGFRINGIGIAAPNGNPFRGTIENAVNLRWKGIIPFVDLMKQRIQVPVITLTNDAKAAAVGEKMFGGAKDMKNFILVTLGAGLGSGIYVNNQLLLGNDGLACEMGHMIVEENGRMCNTKRAGCLEAYASVTGLRRTVFSLLSMSAEASPLRDLSFSALTGEQITEAAKSADPIALEAFEYTGKILGRALANVASLFDPEAIFLGGGLARAGNLLLTPTLTHMNSNIFPAFEGKIKLIVSKLLNQNGGVLGAGALAWQHFRRGS